MWSLASDGHMNPKALVALSNTLPAPAHKCNKGQDPEEILTKVRGRLLLPVEDLKPTLARRFK